MKSSLLLFLIHIPLLHSHPSEYFNESSNPTPAFGSWSTVKGPITSHFEEWLSSNGYGPNDFAQRYFGLFGSYGGKRESLQKIEKTPIVFFHGNEDGALAVPGNFTSGSSAQIECFERNGYSSAELYVTTWGQRDSELAMVNDHSCAMLTRLRRFLVAIMDYTNSKRINVISHSMGVTMARKVVKGGILKEYTGKSCDLGPPLTSKVGVFIGISGANYGMCACMGQFSSLPTCNKINGFYPGDDCDENHLECFKGHLPSPCLQANYSSLLHDLNHDNIKEGQRVYSMWTINDDIMFNSALVWGRPTSFIPNSELFVYRDLTHMETKESTCGQQLRLLQPFSAFEEKDPERNFTATLLVLMLIFIICIRIHSVIVNCNRLSTERTRLLYMEEF